uniref:DUF1501 domain-containing protein n=1 Tax=uncultured Thiotrichaceae bacterium TaxID=298394 RepID=A0A6S6SHD6_9GAMM|nr:MAG: Unknown protein [uncultured Thiotrichaceae bacterium]
MNRRLFLQNLISLSAGSSFASPLFSAAHAAESNTPNDFKALVCIMQMGGNDSANMIVPRSTAEYNTYAESRPSIALPVDGLLPITPRTANQGDFGLHPKLTDVQRLFGQDKAAIIANVGTLLEPTTKEAVDNNTAALPPYLFSHSTQRDIWQSATPFDSVVQSGWAGRMIDQFTTPGGRLIPPSLSISGSNYWQSGTQNGTYRLQPTGTTPQYGISPGSHERRAFSQLLGLSDYKNMYANLHGQAQKNAVKIGEAINDILLDLPSLSEFGFDTEDKLSSSLRITAQMIIANQQLSDLQLPRLTFYVSQGGYDTHNDQLTEHTELYASLNASIHAFITALEHYGLNDSVTTFTASDFGRTISANEDGTDHGWGGHHLIFGGAVKGGDIYGTMPDLALDGANIVKKGRLLPGVSTEQYAATLCKWFGVPDTQLPVVLPMLANFDETDLGFMRT